MILYHEKRDYWNPDRSTAQLITGRLPGHMNEKVGVEVLVIVHFEEGFSIPPIKFIRVIVTLSSETYTSLLDCTGKTDSEAIRQAISAFDDAIKTHPQAEILMGH